MKKYLVFAMAAVCMVASCKKNPLPVPEDETPVAVEFRTQNLEATVTRTKGAGPVTEWAGQTLKIYGFPVQRTNGTGAQIALGEGRYSFETGGILIDNDDATAPAKADPAATAGRINVYRDATEPYYYDVNTDVVYDFYAYYHDDAKLEAVNTTVKDVISYPVTINGTQDLMYANTDKSADIIAAGKTLDQIAEHQAYGTWAARRGVHPTLIFNHALSQFTFNIKEGTSNYDGELHVISVQVIGSNKGTFTVVGKNLGYVLAEDDDLTDSFTIVADEKNPQTGLAIDDKGYKAIPGQLMVAPNQENIKIKVTLHASNYTVTEGGLITYEITLPAVKVKKKDDDKTANKTHYLPGESYEVNLTVYGPEEIDFSVNLTAWKEGFKLDYDPDSDESGPAA